MSVILGSTGITFPDATTQTTAAAQFPAALSTASGSAPSYSARAWVNFDGTTATPSTIRGSANVSSVTKNSTGDYTMNFTTAMSDGNYATVVSGTASTGGGQVCLPSLYQYASSTSYATTSSIRLFNVSTGGGGGNADTPFFNAVVFR